MAATLDGWLWVPKSYFVDVEEIKRLLTFTPKQRGDKVPEPIQMYQEGTSGDVLGVPQAWGLAHFGDKIEIVDRSTNGESFLSECQRPNPNHPAVADPAAQAHFLAEMEAKSSQSGSLRFRAEAPTGTGKTVVGAWVAGGVVRRKTIVLSHLQRINDQWVQTFRDILGVPEHRIGMIQDGRKDWQDKDVVVGTLQSVALKPGAFPEEFYRSFGCMICDEVHRCGAPAFSQAMWQFPAAVRFGLSATHERKDGADAVIRNHLGEVEVRSRATALPMEVWPVWYEAKGKVWGDNHGARVLCITRDRERNERIIRFIKRMYDAGRNSLVVGDKVDHLEQLMGMAERAGVPKQAMGQFTSERTTMKRVMAGERWQEVKKREKIKAHELERVKQESQIIFATYGMFKEGIDVPRLDSGIDVTPRSDATQLIGRIRRPYPDKKLPVLWVTIVDAKSGPFLGYYKSRLAEYEASGAKVVHRH